MKNYIVLFREPDGRLVNDHSEEEISIHRKHWADWVAEWGSKGKLAGGDSLTLTGNLITGDGTTVTKSIHKVGTEIVGGFLLLKADNLDEATEIAVSCQIYEFDAYAEVRELQN